MNRICRPGRITAEKRSCTARNLKLKTQARQLEEHLSDEGWRIVQRESAPHWWADELWTIESMWRPVGLKLWITFLVDPQHDGVRKKGEHVWAVAVTPFLPVARSNVDQTSVPIRHGWALHRQELLGHIRGLRSRDVSHD
jgi:hypothetical protein